MSEDEKTAAAEIAACLDIAKRLKARDAERYGPVYGWINGQVKARDPLELILDSLAALEKEIDRGRDPAGTVREYLFGIRRRILREEWTAKLRSGEATIGDLLAPVLGGLARGKHRS